MHKPKVRLELNVPRVSDVNDIVTISPQVITARWMRNDHHHADELTVSIPWQEGGIDPRQLKNARCLFYMWDDHNEEFDANKHLRFTGIAKKVKRSIPTDSGWNVDLTFHDYTTLFIANKPLITAGMPKWSDTLKDVWERICDNTGYWDVDKKKIFPSVLALRDGLVFEGEDHHKLIGDIVPKRFHAVSQPSPKHGASSWDVWQWVVGSLGLVSAIDKDKCYISTTTEHFSKENPPAALYGQNIHTWDEDVDTTVTAKGIMLKSYDHLSGRVMEAFYPLPGDDRIKTKRAAARPKSEGGTAITENEVCSEYEQHNRFDIQDQKALEECAQQAYEERSRQELAGSFHTSEMQLFKSDGTAVDILTLRSGDPIRVDIEPEIHEWLAGQKSGIWDQEFITFLTNTMNYAPDLARLVAKNLNATELQIPIFHIKTVGVEYGPENFSVQIAYHNLIRTST